MVEFGRELSPEDNKHVHALARALTAMQLPGLIECVPAFGSLMISLDPLALSGEELIDTCRKLIESGLSSRGDLRQVVEVPVLYGGESGPDLDDVAKETGLTQADVVRIHTERPYLVYMIGFMPGYPYLGGLNPKLSVPRLQTPRTRVPAGSVAIAEKLTGIYSVNSPGGWRLIGRTPLKLFVPEQEPPTLLRPGQYVRFVSVSPAQYADIEGGIAASRFTPAVYDLEEEVQA